MKIIESGRRKKKEEWGGGGGGGGALEIITDTRKNYKTKKNYEEYVPNRKTRDGTCVLFCVPPSFVLTDNKMHSFMRCLEQMAHRTKATKN